MCNIINNSRLATNLPGIVSPQNGRRASQELSRYVGEISYLFP